MRELPGELAREMRTDNDRVLVLRTIDSEAVNRGKNRVRVELAHVKGLVAALAEAAADPVALPTTSGEYRRRGHQEPG